MSPRLALVLYPELRGLSEADRAARLRAARRAPFDFIELLGLGAALVVVTAVTRYGAIDLSLAERLGMTVANFIVALPLVALMSFPFHVRRVRRALAKSLGRAGRDAA